MSSSQMGARTPLRPGPGLATFVVAVVGLLGANLVPLMLLAMDGIGLSPTDAGAMMTGSLLATAVVALATMRWVAGPHRRLVARVGLVFATVGYAAAAFATAAPVLLAIALIVAGAGAGAAVSAGGAALASFQGSNRVVGFNVLFNRGLNAILLAAIPVIGLSMLSAFGAAALVAAIALVVSHFIPAATTDLPHGTAETGAPAGPHRGAGTPPNSRTIAIAGVVLLASFAVWALSEDSLWAIAGAMGADQANLDDQLLGLVLSLSTVGGLLGALLVVVTGPRFGRAVPLVLMLVIGGALKLASAFVTDPVAYAAILIAWNFIYGIAYTYFIAAAAGLDARGRWSGPILGIYLVGSSFAPLFATWVSTQLGYAGFGIVIGLMSVLLALPVAIVARLSTVTERAADAAALSEPDRATGTTDGAKADAR
jgi:DHA1 family inner membrane transport protein